MNSRNLTCSKPAEGTLPQINWARQKNEEWQAHRRSDGSNSCRYKETLFPPLHYSSQQSPLKGRTSCSTGNQKLRSLAYPQGTNVCNSTCVRPWAPLFCPLPFTGGIRCQITCLFALTIHKSGSNKLQGVSKVYSREGGSKFGS